MNGWTYYGTRDLQVCPYMEGCPIFRDEILPHLYARTKEEGNLATVFQDDHYNLGKFVSYFERIKTLQVLCKVRENRDLVPVGYSWVDTASGVDGERGVLIGFCFFRDGREVSRDLGRLGLAYLAIDLRISIFHGVILEHNTKALNYAKRLGFKTVAYVPKWKYVNQKLTGVHVVQLEANDFLPGFEEWLEKQNAAASSV